MGIANIYTGAVSSAVRVECARALILHTINKTQPTLRVRVCAWCVNHHQRLNFVVCVCVREYICKAFNYRASVKCVRACVRVLLQRVFIHLKRLLT